jgi:hypothetical protein
MHSGGDYPFVLRHAWLLFVLVTCVQAVIWWHRAQSRIVVDPRLDQGFRIFIRIWLVYANLPWLLLGIGVLCGAVPARMHALNEHTGPIAALAYVTVVLLWVALFEGLFFQGGAETLLAYPGIFDIPFRRPWTVKLWFLFCLSAGVTGACLLLFLKLHLV